MTSNRPPVERPNTQRERTATPQISLVCVSLHKRPGAAAKELDELVVVKGKWAWCPSGAAAGHDWQPVKLGSVNALRVQLAEVSRLVDVAMSKPRVMKETPKTKASRSRAQGR